MDECVIVRSDAGGSYVLDTQATLTTTARYATSASSTARPPCRRSGAAPEARLASVTRRRSAADPLTSPGGRGAGTAVRPGRQAGRPAPSSGKSPLPMHRGGPGRLSCLKAVRPLSALLGEHFRKLGARLTFPSYESRRAALAMHWSRRPSYFLPDQLSIRRNSTGAEVSAKQRRTVSLRRSRYRQLREERYTSLQRPNSRAAWTASRRKPPFPQERDRRIHNRAAVVPLGLFRVWLSAAIADSGHWANG